jgi:hypothetical protein
MKRDEIVAAFTTEIVATNEARLTGEITREQHAGLISRIHNSMNRDGITWEEINKEWEQ